MRTREPDVPGLLDKGAFSNFLQLLSAGRLAIQLGTFSLTWSGTATSNSVVVPHGIGRTPFVFVQPHDTGNVGNVPTCQVAAVGSATFTASAWAQQAGSYSVSYFFLAIG